METILIERTYDKTSLVESKILSLYIPPHGMLSISLPEQKIQQEVYYFASEEGSNLYSHISGGKPQSGEGIIFKRVEVSEDLIDKIKGIESSGKIEGEILEAIKRDFIKLGYEF